MSTESGNDPVTWADFEAAIEINNSKINKLVQDLERRNDESGAQRDTNIRIEMKNMRDELATAINQLSTGVRQLAEAKGAQKDNFVAELFETFKPILQKKMLGEMPQTEHIELAQKLTELRLLGINREVLNHDKIEVRKMLKSGRLKIDEVISAGIDDVVDRTAIDRHARI